MSRNRSSGQALSFKFLSLYSSAVHADFVHAKKMCESKDWKNRKYMLTPKHEVQAFKNMRAVDQNMVMSINTWNGECNAGESLSEYTLWGH